MVYIPVSRVKSALGALLSLFLISSCSDPATVGIELAPGNNQLGVFFAEFELPAEVVLLDSFNTTNQGFLIVGHEEDDLFGVTEGIGYSRMFIEQREERPRTDAILDSIFFQLDIQSVNGENLDEPKYLSVHRLAEPILDTLYYNFDALEIEEEPIAFSEITFGETRDTTALLNVTEEFSEEIFDKMKRGLELQDLFSFRDYFPGIAVKAREGDNSTVGIAIGFETGIFAYYHYEGDTVASSYEITTASSRSFNGVSSDRSGTPTQVVQERNKSYDVGPIVGMKANLGMAMKIDTSPFDAFLDTLAGVTFNQISLEIGEIEPMPETQNPLSAMVIYFTDETNEVLERPVDNGELTLQTDGQAQVDIVDEDGTKEPAIRAPAVLRFNPEEDSYRQGISSYVNALFRGDLTRTNWLLYANSPDVSGDEFKRSLRQFKVKQENIKVKVIYSKTR